MGKWEHKYESSRRLYLPNPCVCSLVQLLFFRVLDRRFMSDLATERKDLYSKVFRPGGRGYSELLLATSKQGSTSVVNKSDSAVWESRAEQTRRGNRKELKLAVFDRCFIAREISLSIYPCYFWTCFHCICNYRFRNLNKLNLSVKPLTASWNSVVQ